jgi:hypothetical protein
MRCGGSTSRRCHRDYFTAKSLPKHLGNLQTFETPAPKVLLANRLTPALALLVPAVTVPSIDGVKPITEATIRDCDLHDEREAMLVDARRRSPFS